MTDEVVVIGAGGFGRETLDVLQAAARVYYGGHSLGEPVEVLGTADDRPSELDLERLAERGVRYLGTTEEILTEWPARSFVIGIGDPLVKEKISARFTDAGWKPVTAIHPNASIGTSSLIGDGSVICGGVQLSTNTVLGHHVHLNPNATIGHDTRIGDFVSANPASVVSGEVVVERGSLLGAGSIILQGIQIGQNALVGAGACVVKDVEQNTTVIGIPARPLSPAPRQSDMKAGTE